MFDKRINYRPQRRIRKFVGRANQKLFTNQRKSSLFSKAAIISSLWQEWEVVWKDSCKVPGIWIIFGFANNVGSQNFSYH